MSLSDPLLKELKGYASKLLTECTKPISDDEPILLPFCDCLERILYNGLLPQKTVIGVIVISDCWFWLKCLGDGGQQGIPFAYSSSVDEVLKSSRVTTSRGRVRLLIRACLLKRCLYAPIQNLVNEGQCQVLYASGSVLGEPVLAAVLTSLLLCLSTIPFSLQLDNAAFLDSSWDLPLLKSLVFVPTSVLGLYIMFVDGKAIILNVQQNSVAAESEIIESGDVIDCINGVVINKSNHGSLSRIIKKATKKPITLTIIKGMKNGKIYPPIVQYWQQAGLDPSQIEAKSLQVLERDEKEDSGKLMLVSSVSTGSRGDIRQINEVITNLPTSSLDLHPVSIECYPLGIRLISLRTNEVIKEHTYMEISACGSSLSNPSYFGYIAGDTNYAQCKDFLCYIFYSKDQKIVNELLKTIGQGFKRTLYTV